MASKQTNFPEQIKESRSKIRDCFQRSHEALQLRESILLSRIDQIEKDYNNKTQKMNKLVDTLNANKSMTTDTLTDNELKDTLDGVISVINKKIAELIADTDSSIAFEWNDQFETEIQQLGSIKLNSQTNLSPTRTFPPQVKPVVPNYKAKQLPIAYCCKRSVNKAPGELNNPRGI
ncbi:hypothetical protein LOD99_11087 [Oopsacas minuta]|uniref:Uncharacterized protein n=1 Tax=Oopsacas minuta TaxID=111878 RepID=A0AAV7KB12_9METZ|nr:hypothetical protein LOD99_11087 [Oopsacas minuta]